MYGMYVLYVLYLMVSSVWALLLRDFIFANLANESAFAKIQLRILG